MKTIKWAAFIFLGLILAVILAALIIPKFVDVAKYKPRIEKQVADATGRPFAIGGDLTLSIFPKTQVSFSELKLGNLPGFEGAHLLYVKFFDVQLKLFPLLAGNIEIERFRVESMQVSLEMNKAGQGNWEGLIKRTDAHAHERTTEKDGPSASEADAGLPIKSLSVAEFVIADAAVQWTDHRNGDRRELSRINLTLTDLSLLRPVGIEFSAEVDGKPVNAKGIVGPLGRNPGKGVIPLDIAFEILDLARVSINGTVTDPALKRVFDLKMTIPPFAPRDLAKAAGVDFPLKTADPSAFGRFSFKAALAGSPTEVTISDGLVELDDSRIVLALTAKALSHPDVSLDLGIDGIDLDRYLPPDEESPPDQIRPPAKQIRPSPAQVEKTGSTSARYGRLESLNLTASVSIGQLTLRRVVAEDLAARINARKGVFRVEPAGMKLSQGKISVNGLFDVSEPVSASRVEFKADGVQAGPLLQILLGRDFLEGETHAHATISMKGDRVAEIKKSLNGKGEFFFQNGAIKGVDLVAMINAAEGALDVSLNQGAGSRTEFTELKIPFRLSNGVARTDAATLTAPLVTAVASGTASLVTESLDLRIVPQFAYSSGKKAGGRQTEIRVPVLVGGTFSEPLFRPDLSTIAQDQLEKRVFESKEFKKIFEREELKPLEGAAKGLFKGIFSK